LGFKQGGKLKQVRKCGNKKVHLTFSIEELQLGDCLVQGIHVYTISTPGLVGIQAHLEHPGEGCVTLTRALKNIFKNRVAGQPLIVCPWLKSSERIFSTMSDDDGSVHRKLTNHLW